jgi:hypothetical protein
MPDWINIYAAVLCLLISRIFDGRKEGWRERERQIFQIVGINAEYWKCQKKWHTAGFWERLFVTLSITVLALPNWYLMAIFFAVALWFVWVLYDGLTNMPKELPYKRWYQKFFYSGTTQTGSKIDRLLGEYLPFIKLGYTLILPILITMYLTLEL